jgi:hypothetical protein
MAVPTAYETRWMNILPPFERHRDAIIAGHPDANEETGLVYTALKTILELARTAPSVNGNGVVWIKLADKAEAEKRVLCKHLHMNSIFMY